MVPSGQGVQEAPGRLAHLFCETLARARAANHADGDSCLLAVTQEGLGAALGLSSVHINRTLMLQRDAGLVEFDGKVLRVKNWPKLVEYAEFDRGYLHFDGAARDRAIKAHEVEIVPYPR